MKERRKKEIKKRRKKKEEKKETEAFDCAFSIYCTEETVIVLISSNYIID